MVVLCIHGLMQLVLTVRSLRPDVLVAPLSEFFNKPWNTDLDYDC